MFLSVSYQTEFPQWNVLENEGGRQGWGRGKEETCCCQLFSEPKALAHGVYVCPSMKRETNILSRRGLFPQLENFPHFSSKTHTNTHTLSAFFRILEGQTIPLHLSGFMIHKLFRYPKSYIKINNQVTGLNQHSLSLCCLHLNTSFPPHEFTVQLIYWISYHQTFAVRPVRLGLEPPLLCLANISLCFWISAFNVPVCLDDLFDRCLFTYSNSWFSRSFSVTVWTFTHHLKSHAFDPLLNLSRDRTKALLLALRRQWKSHLWNITKT